MQVTPDPKPVSTPKKPKRLKRTAGFRRNPTLAAQFRFAVLHEFGGRCIMLDYYDGRDREQADLGNDPRGTTGRDAASDFRVSPAHSVSAVVVDEYAYRCRDDASAKSRDEPQLPDLAHICDGPLDPAHLIPKQTLRNLGFPEAVVYDHRNGVAACRRAHRRNDSGLERFPSELLPPSVFEFARDFDLTYLLDKLYERSTG